MSADLMEVPTQIADGESGVYDSSTASEVGFRAVLTAFEALALNVETPEIPDGAPVMRTSVCPKSVWYSRKDSDRRVVDTRGPD